MTLCLLNRTGVFADEAEERLPARLRVVPHKEGGVRLDGAVLPMTGDEVVLPATLTDGRHSLVVGDRRCEDLVVKNGNVKPGGFDARALVASLRELLSLQARVGALEEKQKENDVNWLV